MFNYYYHHYIISFISAILLILNNNCHAINFESSFNISFVDNFSPAVATWYGPPRGVATGGACGFENDVAYSPYNGIISAGNNFLFKSGKGCGSCYLVKCTQHPSCSSRPIIVTITDECPGACNNDAVHFDLSGKAFGLLAKPRQDDILRNAGRINIQYQRIDCNHRGGLTFKIDKGSNPYYLALAIENVNGDGDIGEVKILASNSKGYWLTMAQSWGATWRVDLPGGTTGPYSVKVTTIESKTSSLAYKAIPANWAPGQHYYSRVVYLP
ncbi:hypothetical protein CASFOL_006054 [Castilleja foliolosa]|uniref:Uncharacterized protein n=1 Tax=Castilleja foliolosa TaxID=1961234 RepID=A0ABD3E689_9LAMI